MYHTRLCVGPTCQSLLTTYIQLFIFWIKRLWMEVYFWPLQIKSPPIEEALKLYPC